MKRSITVLLSVLMIAALMLSGCSKESEPKTLESVVNSDSSIAEDITSSTEGSGVTVDIKENTVTYTYDFANIESITDEVVAQEEFVNQIETALAGQESTFVGVAKTCEEETGVNGVLVKVIYKYKDKELVSSTYDVNGKVED
jgi:PBP1b-binding outer membrane lipoprotein LpoB